MKKTLIIVFLVLLKVNLIAQEHYNPVLGQGFKWHVPITQMESCFVDTVYVVPDSSWYNVYYYGQWYNQIPQLLGKMYESEDKSKLYFCNVNSSEFKLIMDLDMDVGDEFTTYNLYYQPITLTVVSVYNEGGRKHIKFNHNIGCWSPLNYDTDNSSMMFIEGVGPNYGFGLRFESDVPPFYFICKHEIEELVYSISNGIVENCDFIESKIPTSTNDMQISYLADDVIRIETKETSGMVSIYDINGKFIDRILLNGGDICIDISQYMHGIYFIKLESSDIVLTKKILKL